MPLGGVALALKTQSRLLVDHADALTEVGTRFSSPQGVLHGTRLLDLRPIPLELLDLLQVLLILPQAGELGPELGIDGGNAVVEFFTSKEGVDSSGLHLNNATS